MCLGLRPTVARRTEAGFRADFLSAEDKINNGNQAGQITTDCFCLF